MRKWKSLTDQNVVLDDCCHVTSASGTLRSKGHVITFSHIFCIIYCHLKKLLI